MKNNEIEKYITELSPDLQEKARQCRDAEELNTLLAENDVELSEDALEAVAGGCSCSDSDYNQGDLTDKNCPECGAALRYWDQVYSKAEYVNRYYCTNPQCICYNKGLWLAYSSKLVFHFS